MPNTSATGGYLTPAAPLPDNDDALLDFMQTVVVGVTGMPGSLVRPAYQENPPAQPGVKTDWCGISILNQTPENGNAYELQGVAGSTQKSHESFDMRCSFYGPSCKGYASIMRDGLEIGQNREPMFLAGIAYVGAGSIVPAQEEVHNVWYDRADITLQFRRELVKDYSVLYFDSADGTINTENMTIPWAVRPEV